MFTELMRNPRRAAVITAAAALVFAAAAGWMLCAPETPDRAEVLSVSAAEPRRLDLNEASAEELEDLPGIGPVLAERILARRAELGAFRTREDVLSVPGVGEAVYAGIEPYITF